MSSPVEIIAATPSDVPAILDFIRRLAEYEHLADQVQASEAALSEHLFGDRPAAEVLMARADQRDVGFALFFQNFSTFLARPGVYLEDLFVLPEYRGRGVGRALLERVAEIAVSRSCGRLEWSVLDWNEPALRFYRSLGAKPLDGWTGQRLSGDALIRLGTSGQ